jgi:hypothetical protein
MTIGMFATTNQIFFVKVIANMANISVKTERQKHRETEQFV